MRTAIKNFLRKLPLLDKIIKRREFKQKYATEIALYKNREIETGPNRSILHFSVNKAATQHIKKVLRKLALNNGLKPVHLHEYAFFTNEPYLDQLSSNEMAAYQHLFRPEGFLYSVFGGLITHIDDIKSYKILLTVRDPRDILVSSYFSMAYSHRLPPEGNEKRDIMLARRKKIREQSIDEYILQEQYRIKDTFLAYYHGLITKCDNEQLALLKYEEMTADYGSWLDSLASQLPLDISQSLREQLIAANKQKAKEAGSEDKYRHRRKGRPGDYKEKLQDKTIQTLNKNLEPVLKAFGYSI